MSSMADIDKRFAPPTALVEDPVESSTRLGGRWARLGAQAIDCLLQGVAYAALTFTLFGSFVPLKASPFSMGAWQNQACGFVLFAVLQGYLLATRGQTIGKKILGLRIIRTDGSKASFGRLVGLRCLVGWLPLAMPIVGVLYWFADSLMIFRASRQCLHDNIADTIVVKV